MKKLNFIFLIALLLFSCKNDKKVSLMKGDNNIIELKLNKSRIETLKKKISLQSLKDKSTLTKIKYLSNNDSNDINCFYEPIICGSDTSYVKVCPTPAITKAHSVTGEIGIGQFTAKSDGNPNDECNYGPNCIPVVEDDYVSIGVSLNIDIPCSEITNSPDLSMKMKLFGNTDVEILDFDLQYYKHTFGNYISSGESIQNDVFTIQVQNNIDTCEVGKCTVKMFVYFKFMPTFIDAPCRPEPYYLAFQLEDNDVVEHENGSGHGSSSASHGNSAKIAINLNEHMTEYEIKDAIKDKVNKSIVAKYSTLQLEKTKMFTNVELNQTICNNNPVTLADFRNANKNSCGHISLHTLVLRVPLCSSNINEQISQEAYYNGSKSNFSN